MCHVGVVAWHRRTPSNACASNRTWRWKRPRINSWSFGPRRQLIGRRSSRTNRITNTARGSTIIAVQKGMLCSGVSHEECPNATTTFTGMSNLLSVGRRRLHPPQPRRHRPPQPRAVSKSLPIPPVQLPATDHRPPFSRIQCPGPSTPITSSRSSRKAARQPHQTHQGRPSEQEAKGSLHLARCRWSHLRRRR